MQTFIKVKQSRNVFFKPTIPPKNKQTKSFFLPNSTVIELFCSWFGKIWGLQKVLSTLTDFYVVTTTNKKKSEPFWKKLESSIFNLKPPNVHTCTDTLIVKRVFTFDKYWLPKIIGQGEGSELAEFLLRQKRLLSPFTFNSTVCFRELLKLEYIRSTQVGSQMSFFSLHFWLQIYKNILFIL